MVSLLLPFIAVGGQQTPIDQKVERILSQLTLDEKVSLTHGGSGFATKAIARLGIPEFKMTDGPHGVRGPKATYFPTGISLASTFNPALVGQFGVALGREARAFGTTVQLGPAVNMIRTPLGGRTFEYMTEDPFLASKMVVPIIRGIQSQGVAACVKHFAANNQEIDRMDVNTKVDERVLRELYFPAFKAAVKDGGVLTVMSAYNKLNGAWCSENPWLLNQVLKKEWGFRGSVISDWGAVHSTVATALAGCDLEMPGSYPGNFLNEKLAAAVRAGQVPEKVVDEMVRRNLRAMFTAQSMAPKEPAQANTAGHLNIARYVSDESITLLKNEGKTLPLDRNGKYKIAVIGPGASSVHGFSGGSSAVDSPYEISPLHGIQGFVGPNVQVEYALGVPYASDEGTRIPENVYASPVTAHIFLGMNLDGDEALTLSMKEVSVAGIHDAQKAIPKDNYSVRFETTIRPIVTGQYKIGTRSDDGSRLFIDDKLIVDNWKDQAATSKFTTLDLIAGTVYKVRVEYYQGTGEADCSLVWMPPTLGRDPEFWKAVELAKKCDVAIVCVGTNHKWDTEGWDKPSLKLMGDQGLLVRAVAQVNPKTIVVLTNGSPVSIENWDDEVKSILEAWYPGMEGGNSIARILFGAISPSGKLTVSFPVALTDSPAHQNPIVPNREYPGVNKEVDYSEGLLMGYRWFDAKGIQPAYPFGHGLSYTTFRYEGLRTGVKGGVQNVQFDLVNSGSREGGEVAQLYVRPINAPVFRPIKELKGFQKVFLKAGQKQTLTFELSKEAFGFFDPVAKKWRIDAGAEFEVLIGSSSRDIRLRTRVRVKDAAMWAD